VLDRIVARLLGRLLAMEEHRVGLPTFEWVAPIGLRLEPSEERGGEEERDS
jgi:hypothetical protein